MTLDLDLALLRSFVAAVELRGVTAAARQVGRTQSAVSQQLQRLEAAVGCTLFRREGRRLALTPDGELLLHYARALLQLNDEAQARLRASELLGRVRFGMPDLYAAYLLPEVLQNFARAHPRVEIELHCAMSARLLEAFDRGELDLALVTGRLAARRGQLVRREPLVWVAAEGARPEEQETLPLAMLPVGALYRETAVAALGRVRRPWRVVCVSESIAGLQAAVFAGLAVSVVARCAVVPGMRVLPPSRRLPELPSVDLELHLHPAPDQPAVQRLAEHVQAALAT